MPKEKSAKSTKPTNGITKALGERILAVLTALHADMLDNRTAFDVESKASAHHLQAWIDANRLAQLKGVAEPQQPQTTGCSTHGDQVHDPIYDAILSHLKELTQRLDTGQRAEKEDRDGKYKVAFSRLLVSHHKAKAEIDALFANNRKLKAENNELLADKHRLLAHVQRLKEEVWESRLERNQFLSNMREWEKRAETALLHPIHNLLRFGDRQRLKHWRR